MFLHYPTECRTTQCLNMMYYVLLGFVTIAAAYPGIIHQQEEPIEHQALIGESGHHHHVEHEHAKSHQSIKFEHFHPVPVYVKKEHSHLLHHPLEKGKSELELKQIHPETQHNHGGGLVLEDHRLDTEHLASYGHEGLGHGIGLEHGLEGGFEQQLGHGLEQGGYEHGGYEQFAGSYGGEGIKAYGELEHAEPQGNYYEQGSSGEYNYQH
ncbi:uncharacterized protein LOC121735105 [Aricia agestis]|uniref:uncharacterized protein LOC121735105 n=1 Tax=Aricia agestis TaxID=91739 RepID=UPI001C202781|nr:uncharacterized protein LOC121735105 [Aricia agestis]